MFQKAVELMRQVKVTFNGEILTFSLKTPDLDLAFTHTFKETS